jgi:hypothetical protein
MIREIVYDIHQLLIELSKRLDELEAREGRRERRRSRRSKRSPSDGD